MKVVLTANAEADLEAIGDWIAEDAPQRAISFISEIRQACEQLGEMPKAHPLLPGREAAGIRRRVFGNYLIFYTVNTQVEVLHVLHGARDYDAILFPR